ncbi:MAG: hypothetical protein GXP32_07580 [Kiritimatiellaeota bacterium]|nr:hypothetical protein [Kiritimatiellota bacterium]
MGFLKKTGVYVVVPAVFVLLVSCSSSRNLAHPYSKVADLAKKEFHQNVWTKKSTKTSEIDEWKGGVKIMFRDWRFPHIKIYGQIEVVDKGVGKSKLYVFVKDCDSWWYPFNLCSPSMQTDLLDAFEKQLKWYKVTSMGRPWDRFNKKK